MQERTFWGLALILIGGLYLLNTLNIVPIDVSLWRFWPLLIFVLVLKSLLQSRRHRTAGWGTVTVHLFILAWSGVTLAHNLELTEVTGGDVFRLGWPLLLIGVGLSLLLGGSWHFSWSGSRHGHNTMVGDFRYGSRPWVFENLHLAHAVGDVVVDLTTATIAPGDHELTVAGGVGDVSIWLPEDVDVEATAAVNIGDLHVLGQRRSGLGNRVHLVDPAPQPGPEPKRVRIDVNLRIGDVEVRRSRH